MFTLDLKFPPDLFVSSNLNVPQPPHTCKHTLVSFVSAPCQGYLRERGDRQEEESLPSWRWSICDMIWAASPVACVISWWTGRQLFGHSVPYWDPKVAEGKVSSWWNQGSLPTQTLSTPNHLPLPVLASPQENFLLVSSGSSFPLKAAWRVQRPNAKITCQAVSPLPERFLSHTQREHLPGLEPGKH